MNIDKLQTLAKALKAADEQEQQIRKSVMSRRWFVRTLTVAAMAAAVLPAQKAEASQNCGGAAQNSCSSGNCRTGNTCGTNVCSNGNSCSGNSCTNSNTSSCPSDNVCSGDTCGANACPSNNTCQGDSCTASNSCNNNICTGGNSCPSGGNTCHNQPLTFA